MQTPHTQESQTEELNLYELLETLRRRWIFLLTGAALGSALAIFFSSTRDQLWEGSFEILVDDSSSGNAGKVKTSSNITLANLANEAIGGKRTGIQTQMKILQSPSVLMPVFERFRARKDASGQNTSHLSFKDWAKSIHIKNDKDTNVLAVSYVDTQKKLVLSTLRDIADTYQSYSSKERTESLISGVKYTEEQLQIYRKKSTASFRALNSFGLIYGIADGVGLNSPTGSLDISRLMGSQVPNSVGSSFITPSGESNSYSGQSASLDRLSQLNQELIRRKQTFTEKDPSVITIRKERDAIRRYMETSALGKLAYLGTKAMSKDQAQSVVLRYQELEREARQDQAIRESLENALLSLKMEQARSSKPWELLSTPYVNETQISPRPARNLGIGLGSGLLLGACVGLLVDRMSGKIFDKDIISSQLPCPLLADLSNVDPQVFNETISLLQAHFFSREKLSLMTVGMTRPSVRDYLFSTLDNNYHAELAMCKSIANADSGQVLILIDKGSVTYSELSALADQLRLNKNLTAGWIWASSDITLS